MLKEVANFLLNSGKLFFDSIMIDWGVIGYGIVAVFVIARLENFVKRFFK